MNSIFCLSFCRSSNCARSSDLPSEPTAFRTLSPTTDEPSDSLTLISRLLIPSSSTSIRMRSRIIFTSRLELKSWWLVRWCTLVVQTLVFVFLPRIPLPLPRNYSIRSLSCFFFIFFISFWNSGGHNIGRIGTVIKREKHHGGFDMVYVQDAKKHTFATRQTNVFVIGRGGKEAPLISLPKVCNLHFLMILYIPPCECLFVCLFLSVCFFNFSFFLAFREQAAGIRLSVIEEAEVRKRRQK